MIEDIDNKSNWKVKLFPFPRFAAISIIGGLFPVIAGLAIIIATLPYLSTNYFMAMAFIDFIAIVIIVTGLTLMNFGYELWRDARPTGKAITEENDLLTFLKNKSTENI